ncbi:hypothetical protein [Paraconexibacter sp.]|uniref:hypothetical protein n=1 Tax=Paraconexibacter sp. TaxID=2949640 RepID=UPI0035658B18
MNITRTIHIALVTAATTAALSAPALAFGPAAGPTTISNGKPKPVVVWDHAAWKKCWAITYAQWREDGASPTVATAAADLTCGDPPN